MRRLVLLLGFLALPATAAVTDDPAFGRWIVENGKAAIEIHPCGSMACGTLVWMQNPTNDQGEAKRDYENPDPGKRMRHLCRLPLVTGLTRTGPGQWSGGQIYSTRDGRTYGFEIAGVEGDVLKVRGFVGISLLGKTQTWTRDDGMQENCTTIDRPGPGTGR